MTTAGVGPNWHLRLYSRGLIQVPNLKKKKKSTHDPELFLTQRCVLLAWISRSALLSRTIRTNQKQSLNSSLLVPPQLPPTA